MHVDAAPLADRLEPAHLALVSPYAVRICRRDDPSLRICHAQPEVVTVSRLYGLEERDLGCCVTPLEDVRPCHDLDVAVALVEDTVELIRNVDSRQRQAFPRRGDQVLLDLLEGDEPYHKGHQHEHDDDDWQRGVWSAVLPIRHGPLPYSPPGTTELPPVVLPH